MQSSIVAKQLPTFHLEAANASYAAFTKVTDNTVASFDGRTHNLQNEPEALADLLFLRLRR